MSSSNFVLHKKYTEPFDRIYELVTADLRGKAAEERPPGDEWLVRLIETFQDERERWESAPDLDRYRRRWSKLRTKLLRLAAGAYLHVSYDLPRAMANDWPGTGIWVAGPSEQSGLALFTRIKSTFDDNLVRAVRRTDIVGQPSYLLRFAPKNAVRILGQWLQTLRRAAWQHAQILATCPDRAFREKKMRDAMAGALEDTSTVWPWSSSVLEPPDEMIESPILATGLAGFGILVDYLPIGISIIALVISLSAWFAQRRAVVFDEVGAFVDRFGSRLAAYMDVAVRNPEGFDAYRANLRGDPEPEGSPIVR